VKEKRGEGWKEGENRSRVVCSEERGPVDSEPSVNGWQSRMDFTTTSNKLAPPYWKKTTPIFLKPSTPISPQTHHIQVAPPHPRPVTKKSQHTKENTYKSHQSSPQRLIPPTPKNLHQHPRPSSLFTWAASTRCSYSFPPRLSGYTAPPLASAPACVVTVWCVSLVDRISWPIC
jgi:hypothetical protein